MMRLSARRAVLAALVLLPACGSSSSPSATPTPTPTPTPAATPTPVPTPRAFSCPLPALTDDHRPCPKPGAQLASYVNIAIDNVIRDRPELFDLTDTLGGALKVKDRQRYIDAVILAIHAQGVCAKDDNEEIALKTSNDFNEQFNIWTSGGYTRRAYITTCFPARF
jgi:hypothetical protein